MLYAQVAKRYVSMRTCNKSIPWLTCLTKMIGERLLRVTRNSRLPVLKRKAMMTPEQRDKIWYEWAAPRLAPCHGGGAGLITAHALSH